MKRTIPIYGMLTAATVAVSLLLIIPIPATNGFVTLCDAGIYLSALLLGPIGGLTVGALSGGLIDLLSGYPQWLVFSMIIHGLQGWLAGNFFRYSRTRQTVGLLLSSLVMVAGYALATGLLYGWGAGAASVFGNLVQTGFGMAVALPLKELLQQALPQLAAKKARVKK